MLKYIYIFISDRGRGLWPKYFKALNIFPPPKKSMNGNLVKVKNIYAAEYYLGTSSLTHTHNFSLRPSLSDQDEATEQVVFVLHSLKNERETHMMGTPDNDDDDEEEVVSQVCQTNSTVISLDGPVVWFSR